MEPNFEEKIEKANVLVVGAGGIGCELLKNLVITGFRNIVIVDFDTIDVSNLNRQFLFQRQHVGKSKAEVASSAAQKLCPEAKIEFHHRSITDQQFDVNFFKRFDFVMNALDNRAARNHVNRLCLAADVPLIESGSSGYLGQVTVIRKGVTECYECQPKAPQKTFPGCTIRNTPSEPIHCIVWAKHLFNQLFGEADPDEDVSPDVEDPELAGTRDGNEQGQGDFVNGAPESKRADESFLHRISTRKWALENKYDPKILFEKFFVDDINYLLSMANLWKKRTPPKPLYFDSLNDDVMSEMSTKDKTETISDQLLWSAKKCRDVFVDCLTKLKQRLDIKQDGEVLIWDKDDDDCMDFVTSCANLRCTIFNIPNKSRFDTKSMAGNIIAAIATTNAIIAGLIVMEVLKMLSDRFTSCCTTYLNRKPNFRGRLLVGTSLCPPNPKCYVCSSKQEVAVKLDTTKFTVKSLEEKILKQYLHMVAPDVEIGDNKGTIIISSEEGETEQLSGKFLSELKVGDGTRLICDDFKQQFVLTLIIVQSSELSNDVEFEILTDTSQLKVSEEPAAAAAAAAADADEDDEPVYFIEQSNDETSLKKRKFNEIETETSPKRARKP